MVKFFTPWTFWTWYVCEGSCVRAQSHIPLSVLNMKDLVQIEQGTHPVYEDILFFGLVEGMEKEYGYFSYHELFRIHGPFGLKIERDLHFT